MGLTAYISNLKRESSEYCNHILRRYELTDGIYGFLLYIEKNEGCSIGQLAKAQHLDKGYSTRCVYKLMKRDYVRKVQCQEDKRQYYAYLTERGRHVSKELQNIFQEWEDKVMVQLCPEEREQLLRLLDKITIDN